MNNSKDLWILSAWTGWNQAVYERQFVFALVFVQTLYENLPVMSIKSREMSIDYRVSLLKLENDFSFIIDS